MADIKAKNNDLNIYLNAIKKYKLLTKEEEIELAKKVAENDLEAMEKLVNSNLRLVVKIAKKYMTPECSLADLIQEGNIGLLKSVRKFDYRKGVRFSTYASWWIKQSILRYIFNKKRLIRLPLRKEEKLLKINKVMEKLYIELKRAPTYQEIAEKAGFDLEDVVNLKISGENVLSIDEELVDGFSLIDCIDSKTPTPLEIMERKNLIEEMNKILNSLKEKEKEVLKSRYNLDRKGKSTFKKLANKLGLSTETIRQIEIKAKKKIRQNFDFLKEYIYC